MDRGVPGDFASRGKVLERMMTLRDSLRFSARGNKAVGLEVIEWTEFLGENVGGERRGE